MRARIGTAGLWPIFTELSGIRPWELEQLTPAELTDYEHNARATLEARKIAANRGRR